MLASVLRKVSSRANSTLRRMKKSCIRKNFQDNLQKARLIRASNAREAVDYVRKKSSSTIKLLNDSFKVLLATEIPNKCSKRYQPSTLPMCQSLDTVKQQLQLMFLSREDSNLWNGAKKQFGFVKRYSDKAEQAKSEMRSDDVERLTNSKSTQDDREESFGDNSGKNSEHNSVKKPEDSDGKSTKCAEDGAKSAQSDCKSSYASKGSSCSRKTPGTRVPCNRRPDRGSCCSQKGDRRSGRSSTSDRDEMKSRSSIVEEEMEAPDPPPPKSRHWSESVKERRGYATRSTPSPMIYIPCQTSRKHKKEKPSKSKSAKEATQEVSVKEQTNSRNEHRTVCSKSPDRPEGECGESLVAYGSSSEEEPRDSGDSKPNTETLKYRLSKCPSMIDNLKSNQRKLIEEEEKRLEESRETRSFDRGKTKFEKRKKVQGYKSSGEWRKQKYQVRLKIYKKKGCLNPCSPVVTEIWRDDDTFMEMTPVLSSAHREVAKKVRDPCPPKRSPNVDAEKVKLMKMKNRESKKKVKRLKCPRLKK